METSVGAQIPPINDHISRCARHECHNVIRSVDVLFPATSCSHFRTLLAIRQMLIQKNKKLDSDERAALEGNQARVAEAAHLEGMTLEQAIERRKSYRYLY